LGLSRLDSIICKTRRRSGGVVLEKFKIKRNDTCN
jgi:hypothetical protein